MVSNQQSEFLPSRSTTFQSLGALDDWRAELDKDNEVDFIYFDIQKHFDKVPHRNLLYITSRFETRSENPG